MNLATFLSGMADVTRFFIRQSPIYTSLALGGVKYPKIIQNPSGFATILSQTSLTLFNTNLLSTSASARGVELGDEKGNQILSFMHVQVSRDFQCWRYCIIFIPASLALSISSD